MSSAPAPLQRSPAVPAQFTQARSQHGRLHPFLRWWYYLSGPPDVSESDTLVERERVRRGRIASLIILGILGSAVLLVPVILLAAPAMFFNIQQVVITTSIGVGCCLCALVLNRRKHLYATAVLLMIAVDVIVAGIVLSEQMGLDPIILSLYDLLAVTELIAASLLPAASVFPVAVLNMVMLVLDVNAQPRSMMWMQMIQSQQLVYSLLARPAVLYLVVAAVAYLWVTSAFTALKRADRAELIAELERRELERKQELEQAIERILLVQTRVANGDYDARVPLYEHQVLWQVSMAFNTLLSRYKAAAHSERTLRQVSQELVWLRAALRNWHRNQPLRWYPTERNVLSPLADDLRRVLQNQVQGAGNTISTMWIPGAQLPPADQTTLHAQNPVNDPGQEATNAPLASSAYRRPWPGPGNTLGRRDPRPFSSGEGFAHPTWEKT